MTSRKDSSSVVLVVEPLLPVVSCPGDQPSLSRARPLSYSDFLELPYGPVQLSMMNFRSWVGVFGLTASLYGILSTLMLLFSLSTTEEKQESIADLTYRRLILFFFGTPIALTICYFRYGPVRYAQWQHRFSIAVFGIQRPAVAGALYKLGQVYEHQYQNEDALACYQEITTSLPDCKHTEWGAPYYCKIGHVCSTLGRYQEALEAFETCLMLRKETALFVQSDLHAIAAMHEKLGQFDRALKVYQGALMALQKRCHEQSIETAKNLASIGSVYESMSQLENALDAFKGALAIHLLDEGAFPSSTEIAKLYERIGNLQSRQGNTVLALENFRLAVDVHRRRGESDEDGILQTVLQRISHLDSSDNA